MSLTTTLTANYNVHYDLDDELNVIQVISALVGKAKASNKLFTFKGDLTQFNTKWESKNFGTTVLNRQYH